MHACCSYSFILLSYPPLLVQWMVLLVISFLLSLGMVVVVLLSFLLNLVIADIF